ncbi:MAG: chemotaxis protein CheA [Candidatus Thermoplasmatota archaeon]
MGEEYQEMFEEETREHLEKMNQGLLDLEENPSDEEVVEELYRESHTLKGMAGTMGYEGIQEISHKMEEFFNEWRSKNVSIKESSFDLLFECLDTIEVLAFEGEEEYQSLVERLEGALQDGVTSEDESGPEEGGKEGSKKKRKKLRPSDKIKVDLGDLEQVMNLVSELVMSKGTLENLSDSLDSNRLSNVTGRIDRITGELRESVLEMKMTPVRTVFKRFPRMVRDVAKENDKKVNFQMEGEEIELDRTLLDRITDPLVHLLRNAIDHGIEPVEVREKKGKPPEGEVKLVAKQKEDNVVIEVSDDGRGLDKDAIKEKAVEKGLAGQEQVEELPEEEIYMFVFHPHFSTKEEVTEVSGRGIGMEVVKKTMDSLGGEVHIESEKDKGTTITLVLPPSAAIIRSFLVEVGERTYALPIEDIEETVRIDRDAVEEIEGSDFIRLRGEYIPLVHLRKEFNVERQIESDEKLTITIVSKEGKMAGFVIDEVLSEKEIVKKPLPKHLQTLDGFSGATILGDGTIAMLLDSLHWIEKDAG